MTDPCTRSTGTRRAAPTVRRRGWRERRLGPCVLVSLGWLACAACAPVPRPQPDPPDTTAAAGDAPRDGVAMWLTTSDRSRAMSRMPDVPFGPAPPAPLRIEVDAGARHQRMVGFGAAITDASAWLIHRRMAPAQRDALLRHLFGRDDGGLGFGFTRLTIGASDFSLRHYSLDDVPAGATDPGLARFDIAPNREDVVPVVRAALAVNPRLVVMASPWSAPAWMKDGGSLVKGTLLPEHYGAFARYLVRYVDDYAREGIPVSMLTLQNEPAFEPDDYPGMRLSAGARAELVGRHLGPMLAGRRPTVGILEWDHNWDQPGEPLAVLGDPRARPFLAGVAWHCYGGDVSAQSRVRDAFPDKDVYMTECSGGDWEPVRSGGMTLQARRLIVGTTRHWARGVLFWNLALDRDGGPHAGGCDTCRGVVEIDARTGAWTPTDDYYALAHASRFVAPGAWRIGSSEGRDDLDNVAFMNPDGARVLVVVNSAAAPRRVRVSESGPGFAADLPPRSLATFVWHPSAPLRAGSR